MQTNENWKHSSLVNMLSWNYKDKSSENLGKDVDMEVIQSFQIFLNEFEQNKSKDFCMTEEEKERLKLIADRIMKSWQCKYNVTPAKACSSDLYERMSKENFKKRTKSNEEGKMSLTNILNVDP